MTERVTQDLDEEYVWMSTVNVEEIARLLLCRLAGAWNAANGAVFGEVFAADADFVTFF